MESQSSTRTVFTEPRAFGDEDKEDSEILASPVVKHSDTPSPLDEFPEGGLTAWTTTFGVFLVQFCGFGYTTSFGVYEDFYNEHYLTNETSSAISWIGSCNAFLITAVCLISGSLYDRAGGFFFQAGFYYPLFFFQLDSIKHGISTSFSFYSLVILNTSNCVGRVTSGYIAAYIGVPNLIVIATISCGVIILGMIALNSLASVVVLGVFYGYCAGLYIAMVAPLMATLTPDISELGGRMGICSFMSGFGSLIGTPIAGALLTSNYIWWMPDLFAGIIALVGAMMYGIMRFLYVRRQMGKQSLKS
ncbi:hypothetical protein AZE42_01919 [Rhizopogon vesiculosus]|uniref:Major facilitator superfamily (MFS) profile domain-containing protein n=1 Tax=Rhizopogon vesiculosus TaxID=180088 RepID=A0A1J8QKC5_9AGAM|nr:hypothetical protein AZE42_01919 [Rhizopogon vesiculosus]